MYVRVHTQEMWDFRTTPRPLHAPASFWVRHMKSLFESGGFHSGVWANTFSLAWIGMGLLGGEDHLCITHNLFHTEVVGFLNENNY